MTFQDHIFLNSPFVYFDDVLIFSNTEEEHMKHIKTIVNAIHNANMKISGEKSHFFSDSIEFLGHIIFKNGCYANWIVLPKR